MNFESVHMQVVLQLLISFIIGTAIGLEREYRSKAAGLRTMIMICLGSTIFTEISTSIGGTPDRIASNIITGVGFLGAGVIFKDGLTISGITTATTIWIAAALGMAVGSGEYFVAMIGSIVILVVLTVFEKISLWIGRIHHERVYRVAYRDNHTLAVELEVRLREIGLRFQKKRDMKDRDGFLLFYELSGNAHRFEQWDDFLKHHARVTSFEY